MDMSQTTLPQDTHTELDVLFKLFCRPKWKVGLRVYVHSPLFYVLELDMHS